MSRNSTTLQLGEHQRSADKTARIPLKVVKSIQQIPSQA